MSVQDEVEWIATDRTIYQQVGKVIDIERRFVGVEVESIPVQEE
jgi:hypothetical protein